MSSVTEFLQRVAKVQDDLRLVVDIGEPAIIEETAVRLEGLNYTPPVVIPVDRFLRLKKIELLAKIEEIIQLSDEEVYELAPGDTRPSLDMKIQFISALVYYFKQLARLRRNVPEAWDEVDELYVHD